MAVRPILIYGDPRLHQKAEPVEEINDEILELIDDMFESMFVGKGIGLAATQLGVRKAVIVIDLGEHDEDTKLMALINPEIIETKGMLVYEEGCLSIPGVNAEVERPEEITVRYTERTGEEYEMTCSGLLARVIQHEYDHLQGILFPERMTAADRKKINAELRKLSRGQNA
ncbi:peptide deformylase [candidate division KSB1 bacterium]